MGKGIALVKTFESNSNASKLEILEQRLMLNGDMPLPDLTCAISKLSLPSVTVPGDTGKVYLNVSNVGDAAMSGYVDVLVYLRQDGSDVLVGQRKKIKTSLAIGKSTKPQVTFSIPRELSAGQYEIVVALSNATRAEANIDNNTVVATRQADVEWKFGSFDGRKNVKLRVLDANGTPVTFSIRGRGWGEVIGEGSFNDIILSGTNSSTKFTISSNGETVVRGIQASGALKSITAKYTDLSGSIRIGGGLASLQMDDVSGQSTILIGKASSSRVKTTFRFDQVYNLSLATSTPISYIRASEWRDTGGDRDTIVAPSMGRLYILGKKGTNIVGNFEASLILGDLMLPGRVNNSGDLAGMYMGLNLEPSAFARINGQIIDLGSQGLGGMAVSLNNNGMVVGLIETAQAGYNGAPTSHAFAWQNGQMIDLGTLGGDNSTAFDVNDLNVIVGIADTVGQYSSGKFYSHAVIWENGEIRDLGTLGGLMSEATAINASGLVVGRSQKIIHNDATVISPYHAFYWDGALHDLGTLGGPQSWAVDVNDSGMIIGWADLNEIKPGGGQVSHAVIWQNGEIIDLGTLGGRSSAAFAVNNNGQVVGWSETGELDRYGRPILHAFMWEDGVMTDLGAEIVGNEQAVAYISINDAGTIVGHTPNGAFQYQAGKLSKLNLKRTKGSSKSLSTARIAGSMQATNWQMMGSAGTIRVSGVVSNWNVYSGSSVSSITVGHADFVALSATSRIKTIRASSWTNGTLKASSVTSIRTTVGDLDVHSTVSGAIGTVTVAKDLTGRWDCSYVKTLTVRGDASELDMRLQQGISKRYALNRMRVYGTMQQSSITAPGSMNALVVGAMENSTIYAGISRSSLTDNNSDSVLDLLNPDAFHRSSKIRSFTIRGVATKSNGVTNSNVGAGRLYKVYLRNMKTDGNATFGLTAHKLSKLTLRQGTTTYVWPNRIPGQASAPAPLGNFIVYTDANRPA